MEIHKTACRNTAVHKRQCSQKCRPTKVVFETLARLEVERLVSEKAATGAASEC